MKLRRSRGRGNAADRFDPDGLADMPSGLMTLRTAFILSAAVVTAAVAGILTFFATGSVPDSFLAAGPAGAGTITLLHAIVSR